MREYLIKCLDGEWFNLQDMDLTVVWKPNSIASEKVSGLGDYGIRVSGCEISFSYEDPGIQVCIEGTLSNEKADMVVREIAENTTNATGQRSKIVLITP